MAMNTENYKQIKYKNNFLNNVNEHKSNLKFPNIN